jgi:F-type H+-transporting ATPase subunit a
MVSFIPETIFFIGKFPITNTLLDTLIVDALILTGVYFLHKNFSVIPNFFQNTIEYATETFYDLTKSISSNKAKDIFPYLMTFFIFILLANWSGLIPGFGTIGFFRDGELVPLLRGATSDINLTLGLALVSAVATHVMAISTLGIKEYLLRYFSLNPIYLFVGVLEIISEFTKVISLSFRLFGNIFAGEVLISTISSMFAFLLPLPFMTLEIIVGLVQALVFAMLTMAFMAILTTPHAGEGAQH